jgi:orotidine-5'-phosphate decarboxylase
MTNYAAASDPAIELRERLIIALDVPSVVDARSLVNELRDRVGAFKVGLQLFTAAGPEFVRELTESGIHVFLDLKFHDIPNTVAMAAEAAARLGVWMLNVHALGGSEMMIRAREAVDAVCGRESLRRPLMLGVTVLTSSDPSALQQVGIDRSIDDQVSALCRMTAAAGLDGVVASAQEAQQIRKLGPCKDLLIVTPGIRAVPATNHDQKRVMTFGKAIAAGSDYVVVGRPVIDATDRPAALEMLLAS